MSGSGSGGSYSPSTGIDCSRLEFEAAVNSPVKEVVDSLGLEDICVLQLVREEAVRLVVVSTQDGDRVGTITARLPDLFRCIQQGAAFEAVVLSIDGGSIRVKVRPR